MAESVKWIAAAGLGLAGLAGGYFLGRRHAVMPVAALEEPALEYIPSDAQGHIFTMAPSIAMVDDAGLEQLRAGLTSDKSFSWGVVLAGGTGRTHHVVLNFAREPSRSISFVRPERRQLRVPGQVGKLWIARTMHGEEDGYEQLLRAAKPLLTTKKIIEVPIRGTYY